MKRRKFVQYSALGSASFVLNLGLTHPKQVDAFLLLMLRGTLMDMAFGALLQGAFALARKAWSQQTQEWYDRRLDAQLAQREFLAKQFTNVAVAEVREPQYTYILAAQQREPLGNNVAFVFPDNNESSVSAFAGPASIGMAFAAQYLRENERMMPQEVQAALLPRYKQYDNWNTWSEPNSFIAYANRASDNGVLIRYDSVEQHSAGYGIIEVTVNANRRIKIPQIRVKYA